MSVNTSEEYLDELLQAIEPIIYPDGPETIEEAVPVVESRTVVPEPAMGTATELNMEPQGASYGAVEEDDTVAIGDLLASLSSEDSEESGETGMSEEDVDAVLSAVGGQTVEKVDDASYDQDVKELLKQFTEDENLSDIQDILDKNDNGEALDESMLDLPNVEVFQLEEDSEEDEENQEDLPKKGNVVGKLVGGFANLFKKKKDKKQEAANEINTDEEADAGKERELTFDAAEILPDNDISETDIMELIPDEDLSDIEQLLSGGALQGENLSGADKNDTNDLQDEKSAKDKKKSRKEKKNGKDKKASVFSKVFAILTEEIGEPEEEAAGNGDVPEAGATGITNENKNILEELSKEDKKKAKKEAKAEKKKAKKGGRNASENGEDGEEAEGKDKKGKKAKKPKKKKEKPPKVEEISKPEKKLPRKPVISIFVLCFSILAAVLILQNVLLQVGNLEEAEQAYDMADYATCYMNLNGVERSEEEEELYQKSFIILSVQRKLDSYNNFMQMGNEVEALNSLLEGIVVYKEQEANATEWGVLGQITAINQTIWEKLNEYGLSEADVEEILGYESKVTYTKRLDSIVNGTLFVIEEPMISETISEPQPLQDVLPQEEDFLPEDTSEVTSEQMTNQVEEAFETEETEEVEENPSQGNTVVVGSNPVDISNTDSNITGGENVGSGNTDISIELDGDGVVISDL